MRIGLAFTDCARWARACKYLGHEPVPFDEEKSFLALESGLSVVLTTGRPGAALGRALAKYPTPTLDISDYGPASDIPPNYAGGTARPEFLCDAVVLHPHLKTFEGHIAALINDGLSVKVFGPGRWPFPHHLGLLHHEEALDAIASARCVISPEDDNNKRITIQAAGGHPLSWHRDFETPDQLVGAVRDILEGYVVTSREGTFPTVSDRLASLLETLRG